MEPGEYPANVVFSSSYGSIRYGFFKGQFPQGYASKSLQKLEAGWRQDGLLTLYDPARDGIWKFESCAKGPEKSPSMETDAAATVESDGVKLRLCEQGSYEPSSLAKEKIPMSGGFGVSSFSPSPSSSFDNTIRNSQTVNARAVHANASQIGRSDSQTNSSGVRSATETWPSPRDIHECFVSAVLGSAVHFLCRDHGFMPMNSRTLISPNFATPASSNSSDIMGSERSETTVTTLDISLTTLGSVVIKARCDVAPGIQSISSSGPGSGPDDLLPGTSLWLAPGGTVAKFCAILDAEETDPDVAIPCLEGSQRFAFVDADNKLWRSRCLEWLSVKGFNTKTLDGGGWAFVQILSGQPLTNTTLPESKVIFPWPALLCFRLRHAAKQEDFSWPSTQDPLSFAEEWFASKEDRANILTRREKDRQAAEALSREQAEVDARALNSVTISPAALRRGSNAGAIYPTPPDGIQHPVGATPSFDGAGSTPGHPNMLFNNDTTSSQNVGIGLAGQDPEFWGSSDKKEQATTSMNFHDHANDNDNDNVFGDEQGGMFGDITDADFNFFDEQDTLQNPIIQPEAPSPTISVPDPSSDTGLLDVTLTEDQTSEQDVQMQDMEIKSYTSQALEDKVVNGQTPVENVAKKEQPLETVKKKVQLDLPPKATPRFDKDSVFQQIARSFEPKVAAQNSRKSSIYDKVEFEKSLVRTNRKYSAQGRFTYPDKVKIAARNGPLSLPRTEYLEREIRMSKSEPERALFPYIFPPTYDVDLESVDPMPVESATLDKKLSQHDFSASVEDSQVVLQPGLKRKRAQGNENDDEMSSSFKGLAVESVQTIKSPLPTTEPELSLLDSDPGDWALTRYIPFLDLSDSHSRPHALSNDISIATAQLLADQAVSGTIKLPCGASTGCLSVSSPAPLQTKFVLHTLLSATATCIQSAQSCNFKSYLEIQGIPAVNQGFRLPPRPNPHLRGVNSLDTSRSNSIYQIAPPQLEVRRFDSKLAILPPAISFWENLGLSPTSGAKDILATCIYPDLDGLLDNASSFLDQMKNSYETFRLGSHDRVDSNGMPSGLVTYSHEPAQQAGTDPMTPLKNAMAEVSKILSSQSVDEKNFVVYFVYPVQDAELLVHICTAFQYLFYLYSKALSDKKVNVTNELVLQLLPLDFIASPTSIVIPPPSDYAQLAMEVYDRCINVKTLSTTPAILLEQPILKSIDFKLNATPSPSILEENTCLHVAYAQSIDDRWVTAAWTDNRGSQQMTASYCLGRKNELPSMHFSDIAHEIWETTLDLIRNKKIHWRIMIAKAGVMDQPEMEFWTGLAATESSAHINLTLITVQKDPSLRLLPPSAKLSPDPSTAQSVITPVSTPQAMQASTASPETSTANNASTPIEAVEPDNDARLVDITDQSWGCILSHRLNNSNSLLEINPALISGYLMKRGGPNNDDAPLVMEVNIVHSEMTGNPRTFYEGLLREILGYYRGLGTLARVRGVVDKVKDIRPWHIAAAEKAVEALYLLM